MVQPPHSLDDVLKWGALSANIVSEEPIDVVLHEAYPGARAGASTRNHAACTTVSALLLGTQRICSHPNAPPGSWVQQPRCLHVQGRGP
jgi:hypothetical protein